MLLTDFVDIDRYGKKYCWRSYSVIGGCSYGSLSSPISTNNIIPGLRSKIICGEGNSTMYWGKNSFNASLPYSTVMNFNGQSSILNAVSKEASIFPEILCPEKIEVQNALCFELREENE